MLDAIATILVLLLFFIAPFLFVSLIMAPSLINKRLQFPLTRKQIAKKFGLGWAGLFLVTLVVIGLTPDKPDSEVPVEQAQVDKNESQPVKPGEEPKNEVFLAGQTAPNNPDRALAKVVRVIDGDTIEVDIGNGEIKKVRYIGMNAPETDPKECYSEEATSKNKELVEGGIVGLEKDVTETDRFDRLLRYVYVGDVFINQVLVAEGYAHAQAYPPDTKQQEQLSNAADIARSGKKGFWTECVKATPKPATPAPPTQTAPVQSTAPTTNTSGYSCTGPDLDCKDFDSHAEAQAFFEGCGWNKENDPMRLDGRYAGQGDGVACESLP